MGEIKRFWEILGGERWYVECPVPTKKLGCLLKRWRHGLIGTLGGTGQTGEMVCRVPGANKKQSALLPKSLKSSQKFPLATLAPPVFTSASLGHSICGSTTTVTGTQQRHSPGVFCKREPTRTPCKHKKKAVAYLLRGFATASWND